MYVLSNLYNTKSWSTNFIAFQEYLKKIMHPKIPKSATCSLSKPRTHTKTFLTRNTLQSYVHASTHFTLITTIACGGFYQDPNTLFGCQSFQLKSYNIESVMHHSCSICMCLPWRIINRFERRSRCNMLILLHRCSCIYFNQYVEKCNVCCQEITDLLEVLDAIGCPFRLFYLQSSCL